MARKERLSGQTVLILEDEPLLSFDLELRLQDLGATVLTAFNTFEAIGHIADENLSMAVLDIALKDETCELICDHLWALGIPFVFYTGLSAGPTLERWPHVPVILKPTVSDVVVDALVGLTSDGFCRLSAEAQPC